MEITDIVWKKLSELKYSSPSKRREFYQLARNVIERTLENAEPPASKNKIEVELRMFDVLVRTVEKDIRDGIDVFDQQYAPSGLKEIRSRVEAKLLPKELEKKNSGRPNSAIGAYIGFDPDKERPELELYLMQVADSASPHDAQHFGDWERRWLAVFAILRANVIILAAESRIAIAWLILRPILFIGILVAIYAFLGAHHVQNMEVPGFAAIGILSFTMFQMTAVRVGSSLRGMRNFLVLPAIAWIDLALAEGFLYLALFSTALTVLLSVLIALNVIPMIDNLGLFVTLWLSLWATAMCFGFLFSFLRSKWNYFPRMLAIFFRMLVIFSCVFHVTEQLPYDLASWFLINPLVHVIQGLRDAYFENYSSSDVNLIYFYACFIFIASISLILGSRARMTLATP